MGVAQLRSVFAVRPVVVESPELAPMVVDDEPDWEVAVPELLSVEGAVAAVEPVAAPAPWVVLVPAASAAGAAPAGELPVLGAVLDWAHARPKAPAMAAAMTVMLNVR